MLKVLSHFLFTIVMSLAVAGAAVAQAPEGGGGLGPYRFGMSAAEARATAPRADWRSEHSDNREMLTGGPRIELGGRLAAALHFVDDSLTRIILSGDATGDCATLVEDVVDVLEPLYGTFRSLGPYSLERGRLLRIHRTTLGSEVRTIDNDGTITVTSTRYDAMYIIVQGQQADQANGRQCNLELTFGPPSDWQRTEDSRGPTWAELDQAETLIDPVWVAGPTGETFARHYPDYALNRNMSGQAVLECIVTNSGALNCRIATESPDGVGFGAAAIEIARDFRVRRGSDGTPAPGRRLRVPIRFNMLR